MAYVLPDPLPWTALAGPLAAAEDALARLDERLAASPIREAWVSRTHFMDACACLWLQGELVHLEDLVLHDAGMDQRAPTHELTRAHAMLRSRRRIAAADPGWATSPSGLTVFQDGRPKPTGTGTYRMVKLGGGYVADSERFSVAATRREALNDLVSACPLVS